MPWTGSPPNEQFTRTDGVRSGDDLYQQQAAAPVDIEPTLMDIEATDVKDGLNACLKKDGGNTASADIPMGGFKFTNVAEAVARTQYARFSQIQDNKGQYVASVGGTADAITLTPSPAITAYAAGQRFTFIALATNTTAVTVIVSSVGAKSVVRNDGSATALSAGDIQEDAIVDIEYDGTNFLLFTRPFNLVEDTTPELGGDLDTNGNDIGFDDAHGIQDDSGNEQLIFQKTASAVNHVEITNAATGNDPTIAAAGDDTDIDLVLAGKGTGVPKIGSNAILHAGNTASDTAAGTIEIAVQSEMETGTSTTLAVTPGRQHFHPGHPKAGGNFDGSGTPAFRSDYGMGAITDNGTGDYTLALDTAFANTNYWISGWCRRPDNVNSDAMVSAHLNSTKTTSAMGVRVAVGAGGVFDSPEVGVTFWGKYA
jgi:hypothetical protein